MSNERKLTFVSNEEVRAFLFEIRIVDYDDIPLVKKYLIKGDFFTKIGIIFNRYKDEFISYINSIYPAQLLEISRIPKKGDILSLNEGEFFFIFDGKQFSLISDLYTVHEVPGEFPVIVSETYSDVYPLNYWDSAIKGIFTVTFNHMLFIDEINSNLIMNNDKGNIFAGIFYSRDKKYLVTHFTVPSGNINYLQSKEFILYKDLTDIVAEYSRETYYIIIVLSDYTDMTTIVSRIRDYLRNSPSYTLRFESNYRSDDTRSADFYEYENHFMFLDFTYINFG